MWEHPWNATLTGVSSKKRNSRMPRTHRQGLSGNPRRRAQQLQERRAQDQPVFGQLPREPLADPDRAAFRELAYRLAGGAPDEAWWWESHERRANGLTSKDATVAGCASDSPARLPRTRSACSYAVAPPPPPPPPLPRHSRPAPARRTPQHVTRFPPTIPPGPPGVTRR